MQLDAISSRFPKFSAPRRTPLLKFKLSAPRIPAHCVAILRCLIATHCMVILRALKDSRTLHGNRPPHTVWQIHVEAVHIHNTLSTKLKHMHALKCIP